MSKINILPKKGQEAVAEYLVSGKVRRIVVLGIVTKATKKSFHCKNEEGKTVERQYTYGATNGLRLQGFRDVKKAEAPAKEAVAEEEE